MTRNILVKARSPTKPSETFATLKDDSTNTPWKRNDHVLRAAFLLISSLMIIHTRDAVAQDDGGDKVATAIANSWLGHDASELLVQWPVDAGFSTYEVEKTGETGYKWTFGVPAHSYTQTIFDGQQQIDVNVIQQNYHEELVDVAAKYECFVTFIANAEGIITRYEYNGSKCRPYLRSWGKPKAK